MRPYLDFCLTFCLTELAAIAQVAFQGALVTPVSGIPTSMVAADFNHDGEMDVAVSSVVYTGLTSERPILQVFPGNGDGTFRSPVTYDAPCATPPLVAGYFFRSANLDLALVCADVVVFRGAADGTFTGPFTTGPSMRFPGVLTVAAADLNNDGVTDLLVPGGNPNIPKYGVGGFYVLLGNGDGTFQAARHIGSGEAEGISTADFRLDGLADAVTAAWFADTATVYLGSGGGTFAPGLAVPAGGAGPAVLTSDLNGDGIPDLILPFGFGQAGSWLSVSLGNGDGTFQPTSVSGPCYAIGAALPFDGGGNGIMNLALIPSAAVYPCSLNSFAVLPGRGNGIFDAPASTSLDMDEPLAMATGDFNGDGLGDMVFATAQPGPVDDLAGVTARLQVFLNNTPVSFLDRNSAGFSTGAVAPDSIVAAVVHDASAIAPGIDSAASIPLPVVLAGTTVTVADSAGTARPAPLFYVSPGHIEYQIPPGTATGPAVITIASSAGIFTRRQEVVPVSPGLYSVGVNLAAALVATVVDGQVAAVGPVAQSDESGNYALVPIDLGSGDDQVVLELFGTGLRHHRGPVTASIAGIPVAAFYTGAQGVWVGEDQINVPIPASLRGAGIVGVSVRADGQISNQVSICIK